MVKNHREKKQLYPGEPDLTLSRLIEQGDVGKSEGETLIELATFGIYVHHSELPRLIREAVVQHFREPYERQDGLSEILFATETLFYGVNLATDCVILTSPRWPRERPGEFEIENTELSSNEFHNILGRAGRPGMCVHTLPKAVVCIPSWEYISYQDRIHTMVDQYYGSESIHPTAPRISSLFALTDVRASRENRIQALERISYPTFRFVMDALRHLGGQHGTYVFVEDIFALLRKTVFFNSQQCSTEDAESLVKKVLEVSAEAGLVDRHESKYKIKLEAEALIDTGTKWQSVSPMTKWLDSLHQLRDELTLVALPPELLVPAFVSSPDLWNTARKFLLGVFREVEKADLRRVPNDEFVEDVVTRLDASGVWRRVKQISSKLNWLAG